MDPVLTKVLDMGVNWRSKREQINKKLGFFSHKSSVVANSMIIETMSLKKKVN